MVLLVTLPFILAHQGCSSAALDPSHLMRVPINALNYSLYTLSLALELLLRQLNLRKQVFVSTGILGLLEE